MTFLVDENITPEVLTIFQAHGLEAYHVNQLKSHPKQRIIDDQLRRLTLDKGYIIVTRDDDFVRSYVHRKVPDKLIFLYALEDKSLLMERMETLADTLPKLMEQHDFIEINPTEVRFPFAD